MKHSKFIRKQKTARAGMLVLSFYCVHRAHHGNSSLNTPYRCSDCCCFDRSILQISTTSTFVPRRRMLSTISSGVRESVIKMSISEKRHIL